MHLSLKVFIIKLHTSLSSFNAKPELSIYNAMNSDMVLVITEGVDE